MKYISIILLLLSSYTVAGTYCEFTPQKTIVKSNQVNKGLLIVCDYSSICYNLGQSGDAVANSRYLTAITALTYDKKLVLEYPNKKDWDCGDKFTTTTELPVSISLIN